MKKLAFLSLATTLLLTLSCAQQADVNTLLKNPETKDQIFSAITDNHELMTEFMDKMMESEHAKMMMMNDKDMMGMMMKDKSDMMHNMMSGMMKDGQMMKDMMQMMNQEGIMSHDCMQYCMKMMEEKGMGAMKKENMDNDKKEDNHDSHH